jgi:hypothetical protein
MAIAAGLALLAFVAFGFRVWLEQHDDQLKMQGTLDSQKTVIAAADRREQDRSEQLRVTLEQFAAQKKAVTTPGQVIRALPDLLPSLPVPLQMVAAPVSPGGTAQQPSLHIPAEDLKPLYDLVLDCRACQAERESLRKDLDDEHAKQVALSKERDAAVTAARGGSIWTRTKRAAKWVGIGIIIGLAARSAAH